MNKRLILKGARILLIVITLIISTVAVTANRNDISDVPQMTEAVNSVYNFQCKVSTSGDVLWDNAPSGWQEYRGGNTKGLYTAFGAQWLEMCDDFEADDIWTITDGHFEGCSFLDNLQVDEVLVRFFEDNGTTLPKETPFFEQYSTDFTISQVFGTEYWHTIIDVNFDPVVVDPGIYWVQFTPVGCYGDWHYSSYSLDHWGNDCAHRDGDPSGTYAGGYGSYTWIHFKPGQDYNFKLTGYIGTPPTSPIIDGPLKGKPGKELCWTFHSEDTDCEQIKYIIDWGDGTKTETDCVEPCIPLEVCHTYEEGNYSIKAWAQECPEGAMSDPSLFLVEIPRVKASHLPLFYKFLEIFKVLLGV
jgi:hypothetical protein